MVPKRRFQEPAFDRVEWHRREQFHPTGPNQVWSMDFVADSVGGWQPVSISDGRGYP
jgi:transposase InsO family protein